MKTRKVVLWGAADLRGFSTPLGSNGEAFPHALSWAIPMNPLVMAGIQRGPNRAYADEYARVNRRISRLSESLSAEIQSWGFRARALAASTRTDDEDIKGEFSHKTAATRAGLGWVGRHCQLVTRPFGPWVRLGTVFTDLALSCGPVIERSFCGRCMRCVDACPAKALKGSAWHPGVPREAILDVQACDQWKKTHFFAFQKGHNCGVCSAVCPYGLKRMPGKHR